MRKRSSRSMPKPNLLVFGVVVATAYFAAKLYKKLFEAADTIDQVKKIVTAIPIPANLKDSIENPDAKIVEKTENVVEKALDWLR